MKVSDLILSALMNLKRNLKRSILTMLGIIIGIAAVITIVALGQAYKNKTIEEFTGENKGSVAIQVTFSPKDSNEFNMNEPYFNNRDGELLKNKDYIDSYEFIYNDQSFGVFTTGKVREIEVQGLLDGVTETKYDNITGRNINKIDNDKSKKVVVVSESIFPEETNVNEYLGGIITLDNINYEIIGIKPANKDDIKSLFSFEANILMPKSTYKKFNGENNIIYGMKIILAKDADVKESIKKIKSILNENGSNKDKGTYDVFDTSGIINLLGSVLNTITAFIAAVAGISLFIAGIGVMNMVYTSVSERTLEIGIKRALGAKKKDIKREFLYEGIMITLTGGFIGYVIGILIAAIVCYFLKLKATPSLTTVIIAISVSVIVGIASSYLPAKKASNENTVDILK